MKIKYSNLLIGLSIASLSAGSYAAELEEVVVTAQHRAQSIQDVPISISALSADDLEAADIFDAHSISLNVPGMSYSEFAPGQAILNMRGIGSVDDGAGLDNSVGLFLDGVYIGRLGGVNFDLFDLERIEVLKGPQGTLFGRNSIGGAISVVTAKPAEEFSGKAALTMGNEGIARGQAYVTGPLSDSLRAKFVVNHRQHDGFVRNTHLNKDVQDENQTSYRGQLLWDTGSSEWILSADYMEDSREEAGRAPTAAPGFDYVALARSLGAGRYGTNAAPVDGYSDREAGGISLTGEIEFANGTFTTITAARKLETDWEMPSVGAPLGGGFDLASGSYGADVIDKIEEDVDTFSQEFRWTSNNDGAFNYVAGLYYFTEDTDRVEQFNITTNVSSLGQFFVGNEYTRTENETTSYAAYFQGNLNLSESLDLTFGARYTKDERDYTASAVNCAMPSAARAAAGFANDFACVNQLGQVVGGSLRIIAETFRRSTDGDWSDFSPMASLQFKPGEGNVMYYATISKGYKAGGYAGSQGVAVAATNPVNPEEAINYELGLKGDFLDNTLRFNAALFKVDYKDLQVVRFGPVVGSDFGTFQTTNVGEADINGLELDFVWNVNDNVTLSGNYAYLDTEAKDLVLNTFTGQSDFSGLPLRGAPENSYGLTFNYNLPTNSGTYDFRIQYSHVDENHQDFATRTETIVSELDFIDARISWMSQDERYGLALWGKNLTEDETIGHSYRIGPGSISVWGQPRTFGLTGTINF